MFRGPATINVYADDVARASAWYTSTFDTEPYYVTPAPPAPPVYVEFRIGDDETEFGIIDPTLAPPANTHHGCGAIVYWHVDDLDTTLGRLLSTGATAHQPVIDRAPGFRTASVVDPFGNIVGIMHNQHYADLHQG